MEICDLLSEIAHYAAQLTQNQYFTFMYCLGTILIFSYLYRRKFLEGKRIVQACNDATRDVKLESLDENGSPAAGLDSQNVNEFPSVGKRYKEIIFKYNFSSINDAICQNSIFKHHWSEFTESLVHSNDNNTPVRNSHSAAFFFNEDTIILPNYSAAIYIASPNYLTGLGILGTFIGLAGGIYLASAGLSGGFDADNTEKLRTALNQLLSGAGLAFWTSIVGLFCSLVFSVREKSTVRDLQKHLGDFVNALDERVHLITSEDMSRQQLALQEEQRDLMQAFVDHVGQNISEAINGMFSKEMRPVMEKMVSELCSLRSERATESQEVISNLTKELADKIHSAAGKEMDAFSAAFAEMHATLVPLLEEYKESQGRGLEASKAMNDTLQQLVNVHSSLHSCIQRIESSTSVFEEATAQTQKAIQAATEYTASAIEEFKSCHSVIMDEKSQHDVRFEQQMQNIKEHSEIFLNAWKDSLVALDAQKKHMEESLDKHMSSAHEHYEMVKNQQYSLEQLWKRYAERFENIDTALQNTFVTLTEGLGAYSKSTKDYIAGLDDHLERAATQLYGVVSGLKETVEEWQEMREDMETTNASTEKKARG
ncbi:anti-phage ZorAB system protein ZorA [Desulfovibrio desulfuricans]|uniref:anti-phage ZorAB system protein ZorA n=1 Tax=Desulfovibrio desulfuricans TaxID=876 RepID=UPI001AE53A4B|nr:anti-phage ZorAB system protein ZorA [Desulfovibrio desulfuricans]QTO39286.1 anti-phage defense ZorAB system ZorA [Desulfovibrio desulfuricans]